MMKKFFVPFIAIFTFIATNKIYAQDLINPEPTSSSIQSYVKYKASAALGVPSVNVPLYTLESDDKKAAVTLSLSYHLYNSRTGMAPTEVGLGWTMFKGAIISKESGANNNEFTEISNLTKQNSDRFYYSIPGFNGVFQIYKDVSTGELKLYDLNASKLKFEFVRDQSSTKLIINSFKITDDKGLIYNFNAYNITSFQNNPLADLKNQRTAYLPTTVTDTNNRILITYSYDIKTKNTLNPYGSVALKYKVNKLNTITTSQGKLKFEYDYNENADNDNQNKEYYTINSISLLTAADKVVSKFKFAIDNFVGLGSLKKFDSNNNQIENTAFGYGDGTDTLYGANNSTGSLYAYQPCPSPVTYNNPQKYVYRVLNEIYFPTGGRVKYDYEANEVFEDYSTVDFENANVYSDPLNQYYDITDSIAFDTNNTRLYTFTVHGNPGTSYPVTVQGLIGENYEVVGHPVSFGFSVTNSNNVVMQTDNLPYHCTSNTYTKYYRLVPGVYKIKISNWDGAGDFSIVELKSLPKPYKNYKPVFYGARIKKITYYDDNEIKKQIEYKYNSFNDPISSTGYLINDSTYPYVIYKNVRETEVSENQNNGYIDYYYNTPYEYSQYGSVGFTQTHFNLTSQGVLTQKKMYNSQNQLLENTEFTYNFTEIPNAQTQTSGTYEFIPSYVSFQKEINTVKIGNSDYVTKNESTFSQNNFQKVLSKITTQDGHVSETTIKYAQDISDTRLINANMISVPLETVIRDNGNILSTSKTVFGSTNHYYPTAVIATDLAQNPETQITFDVYDDRGNPVQTTDKSGISTVTIWGYYKTLPIAQIVGAKYSDISSLPVITAAIAASNADADGSASEDLLLTALKNLRLDPALKPYSISASTYDPLIGITNSIFANGIKISYTYDSAGRIQFVKDSNGTIVKENQYNYKHY